MKGTKLTTGEMDECMVKHLRKGGDEVLSCCFPGPTTDDSRCKDLNWPNRQEDNWKHRSENMRCLTCMFFVVKEDAAPVYGMGDARLGRCRKHCPTLNGWPAVYTSDWCGDHKLR